MKVEELENIKLYNGDCMEYMKAIPDKHFELAIVDFCAVENINLKN